MLFFRLQLPENVDTQGVTFDGMIKTYNARSGWDYIRNLNCSMRYSGQAQVGLPDEFGNYSGMLGFMQRDVIKD